MQKSFFLIVFIVSLIHSFNGVIIDSKNLKPLSGVIVDDNHKGVKTDENGTFNIETKDKTIHLKAYGYRPMSVDTNSSQNIFKVEPIRVKALYLTFWTANMTSSRAKRVLRLIKQSQANAIVVDVKNEYGSTSYYTSVKQAKKYGAHKQRTNRDIKNFMKVMKENNIYTIARIVTFKDELQASNNPDYAIKKAKTGQIWRNHDGMAWVDPFDKRAHEYTISIAEDAAKVGFDEINFDYIRFPAKDGLLFSKESTEESRKQAIGEFLDLAKSRLRKYGVFISVDTYGNICWSKDDNNIGQTIEVFEKHADYIAPMLYPSGFSSGSFHFKYPAKHPHAVIYRSVKNVKDRIDTIRVRPWLQYFKDYSPSRIYYGKHEVKEQIRATEDINANGWMMWSPSSRYHLDYLK